MLRLGWTWRHIQGTGSCLNMHRLTGTRSARDPQPTRRWNVGFRFGSDCTLHLPTTTEPPVQQSNERHTPQGKIFTEKPPLHLVSWRVPSAGHCKHGIQSPSSALADVASLGRTTSIDICRDCGSAALRTGVPHAQIPDVDCNPGLPELLGLRFAH